MLWICYQQSLIAYLPVSTCVMRQRASRGSNITLTRVYSTCVVLHILQPTRAPHLCKTSSLQVLNVLQTMGTSLINLEGALSTMAKTSSKAAEVACLLSLKDVNGISKMKGEAEQKIKDKKEAQEHRNARIKRMKWCFENGATASEQTSSRTGSPPVPPPVGKTPTFAFASRKTKAKAEEAEAKAEVEAAEANVCRLNIVVGNSNVEKAEEEARAAIEGLASEKAEKADEADAKKELEHELEATKKELDEYKEAFDCKIQ